MEFCDKIKKIRTDNNLTQEQFAEKLYVSRTAVSKWESGKGYPSIDSLKYMSKLFNISIDDLLSSEEILDIAEQDKQQKIKKNNGFIFGAFDLLSLFMIILPLYAFTVNNYIYSVSLFAKNDLLNYIKISYLVSYIILFIIGIIEIILSLLGKENGYNNAVKLLDAACNTLYINSKLASKVQNVKIEDIQEKMVEKDYTKIDSSYGQRFTPSNKYYPSILIKEKEQKVTVGQNTTTGTELDLGEQKTFENQTEKTQADTLDVIYTYWDKKMSVDDFDGENKEMYYKLFINNGSNYNTYWMSSRCVYANSNSADFHVRRVDSGYVSAYCLCYSHGYEDSDGYVFRPVVTLNSNVQAISGDGSESSPFEIK